MKPSLYLLLEDIRSAYNVGSIFRTCDSAGVDKLYLSGITAYPPDPKLNKTALGSLKTVPWEYHQNPSKLADELKKQNLQLLILEPDKSEQSIYQHQFLKESCLVFGNEIRGVSQELIEKADQILNIPQFGKKKSLNVSVAAGIAVYEFLRKSKYDSI